MGLSWGFKAFVRASGFGVIGYSVGIKAFHVVGPPKPETLNRLRRCSGAISRYLKSLGFLEVLCWLHRLRTTHISKVCQVQVA